MPANLHTHVRDHDGYLTEKTKGRLRNTYETRV